MVVVSISNEESELGVEALQAGAVNIVQKPTALATDRLYELKNELVRAIEEAALARGLGPARTQAALVPLGARTTSCELVVIGTSTGGPQALTRLLSALPKDFPVPLAIALHIPAGYTEELVEATGSRMCDRRARSDGWPRLAARPGSARARRPTPQTSA